MQMQVIILLLIHLSDVLMIIHKLCIIARAYTGCFGVVYSGEMSSGIEHGGAIQRIAIKAIKRLF